MRCGCADLAGQAEAAGWDGVYIWDHILIEDGTPMCDPWVAMAAAATVAKTIRLGPMVTPTPRRHPWKLAREVVSLDRLSQGRVDFGVGIGHPPEVEYGSFGHETDNRIRADKLDEGLELVALGPWGSPFFRLVSEHADVFEALPSNLHEALLREYISGASAVGLSSDVLDQLAGPWLGDGQAAFYRQIAQADERFTDEVQRLYQSMQVPTLIVWGTADTWIPVDRAEQLVKLIPNSALQLIDGAGHLVQEDEPARFVAVVSSWLSKQVGV